MKNLGLFTMMFVVCSFISGCPDDGGKETDDKNTNNTNDDKTNDNDKDTSNDNNNDSASACVIFSEDFGDDICWNDFDQSECNSIDGDWIAGSCASEGLTRACEDESWVEDGVPCPSLAPGVCIVFIYYGINDEICFDEDQSECYITAEGNEADPEEEWISGIRCPDEGFTKHCGDGLYVEDGVDCPDF